MKSLVFYSWQSDLPNSTNRGFIETALEKATKTIRNDDSIQVEPVIDRDTVGVPGAPDIASTIFAKIEKAAVFVCDISLINDGIQARPTPNPNVLLELGFAIKALGWDRIVMTMNTAFGKPELLPFDLRMRRVITYEMREDCTERSSERKVLESKFESALRTIFEHAKEAPGEQIQPQRILDQALAAVEASKPNHGALVRRYMTALVGELEQIAPKFVENKEADDQLVEALDRTIDKVEEFARLAESIATMNSEEGASAAYKSFEIIISHYNAPKSFVTYDARSGDFYKFLGHELFTVFLSFLMRENRWRLIDDLLDQELYLENPEDRRPAMVASDYVCKWIDLLESRNRRLSQRKISPQGEMLRVRYSDTKLSSVVSFTQFMNADFFLFLRSFFKETDEFDRWYSCTDVYMRETPRFLLESTTKENAEQLLRPLGVQSIEEFRQKYPLATKWLGEQVGRRGGFRSSSRWSFDPKNFGSR